MICTLKYYIPWDIIFNEMSYTWIQYLSIVPNEIYYVMIVSNL